MYIYNINNNNNINNNEILFNIEKSSRKEADAIKMQ